MLEGLDEDWAIKRKTGSNWIVPYVTYKRESNWRYQNNKQQNYCLLCDNGGRVKCKICDQMYCSKKCLNSNAKYHKSICAPTFGERMSKFKKLYHFEINLSKPLLGRVTNEDIQLYGKNASLISPYNRHDKFCCDDCKHCIICHKTLTTSECVCHPQFSNEEIKWFTCDKCKDIPLCTQTWVRSSECPYRFKLYRSKFRLYMLCCARIGIKIVPDIRQMLWRFLLMNKSCKC